MGGKGVAIRGPRSLVSSGCLKVVGFQSLAVCFLTTPNSDSQILNGTQIDQAWQCFPSEVEGNTE